LFDYFHRRKSQHATKKLAVVLNNERPAIQVKNRSPGMPNYVCRVSKGWAVSSVYASLETCIKFFVLLLEMQAVIASCLSCELLSTVLFSCSFMPVIFYPLQIIQ
jgi:hypothetical protein